MKHAGFLSPSGLLTIGRKTARKVRSPFFFQFFLSSRFHFSIFLFFFFFLFSFSTSSAAGATCQAECVQRGYDGGSCSSSLRCPSGTTKISTRACGLRACCCSSAPSSPSCTISVNPTKKTIVDSGSFTSSAAVTLGGSATTVTEVMWLEDTGHTVTYNGSSSPFYDTSSPYATTIGVTRTNDPSRTVSIGTWGYVRNASGTQGVCQTATNVTILGGCNAWCSSNSQCASNYCFAGQCRNSSCSWSPDCSCTSVSYCYDSDGGVNLSVKGTTCESSKPNECSGPSPVSPIQDSCVSATTVREGYCSGTSQVASSYSCPSSATCVNGACVSS